MSLADIVPGLLEEGRVRISTPDAPTDDERNSAGEAVRAFERRYRLDLPGAPPELSLPAALWAVEAFYCACQCLSFREIGAEDVQQMLQPYSGKRDAAAHYSVDLTFRVLPDLIHRARAASRDDPLVAELISLATAWPLSSVGVDGVVVDDLEAIFGNACLRRLYLDRVIAREDMSRLSDRRARDGIRETVGLHEELAPRVVAAVKELEQQDEHA